MSRRKQAKPQHINSDEPAATQTGECGPDLTLVLILSPLYLHFPRRPRAPWPTGGRGPEARRDRDRTSALTGAAQPHFNTRHCNFFSFSSKAPLRFEVSAFISTYLIVLLLLIKTGTLSFRHPLPLFLVILCKLFVFLLLHKSWSNFLFASLFWPIQTFSSTLIIF